MHRNFVTSTLAILILAAASGHASEWKIDKAHSSIGFTVRHMVVAKVSGEFGQFDGTIVMSPTSDGQLDPTAATANITISAASISTDNDKRDEHLRSADFFDVANHPELTFVSTKVVPGEDGKFQLIGDLTIRGTTKEVTFEGELNGVIADQQGGRRAGFSLTTSINRQEFGVSWSKVTDTGGLVVSDNVAIQVELELVEVKPERQG